jgi:hypothetical protein
LVKTKVIPEAEAFNSIREAIISPSHNPKLFLIYGTGSTKSRPREIGEENHRTCKTNILCM